MLFLDCVIGLPPISSLVWQFRFFARQSINQDLKKIEDKLVVMREKNRFLSSQIRELKVNPGAIESHARLKLGMIERGELFFMVPETISSANEE